MIKKKRKQVIVHKYEVKFEGYEAKDISITIESPHVLSETEAEDLAAEELKEKFPHITDFSVEEVRELA
jgi:hypothetical protein